MPIHIYVYLLYCSLLYISCTPPSSQVVAESEQLHAVGAGGIAGPATGCVPTSSSTGYSNSMLTPFGHRKLSSSNKEMVDVGSVAGNQQMPPTTTMTTTTSMARLKVDDWISFSMDGVDQDLLLCLRIKFHALVMRRMRQPGKGRR